MIKTKKKKNTSFPGVVLPRGTLRAGEMGDLNVLLDLQI